MKDYKKEWIQKAQIDYFSPFISLWLACNSWYRSHYAELGTQDRVLIDKIKSDYTGRNHLYKAFKEALLGDDEKKRVSFRTNLELLFFSLNRAELKPGRLKYKCTFEKLVPDYSRKEDEDGYVNITRNPKLTAAGKLRKGEDSGVIKLDSTYIMSNDEIVFAGLFELIYQVRNLVIHGDIKPENEEHEVVKYCYLILNEIMA